jgi:hypothetical protein
VEERIGGAISHCLGRRIYENKNNRGLRQPPHDEFDTTTNQKQADMTEGGLYRMHDLIGT